MFKQYIRTNIAEMRPVTKEEIAGEFNSLVSVSKADLEQGSPKAGDMVARNPMNKDDQWLVAGQYFKENFKEML